MSRRPVSWQFSTDGKRAAAVYPLMSQDDNSSCSARVFLRADSDGRWSVEIKAEFGSCKAGGVAEPDLSVSRPRLGQNFGALSTSVNRSEDMMHSILDGRAYDGPLAPHDEFARELAEEMEKP